MPSSRALCAIPTASPPTNILARSRVFIAVAKPVPSSPSLLEEGILTSSRTTSLVIDVLIPILFSWFVVLKPGVSLSMMNALIPLRPFDLSVRAVMIKKSATGAFVMKHFLPFNTYSSPSLTAVVLPALASEPAPGSVKQNAPKPPSRTRSQTCCFCSSFPAIRTGFIPRPLAEIVVANPASAIAICSMSAATSTRESPGPPYSSGTSRA